VGAYPVTPINIAIELPDFDPSVYNDAIRGQHLLAMKALRQKFGIDENRTHVEKGLPEEVIPDLSEHLQAGIVVLGTSDEPASPAAFLGNTAEQVIDHLRCDLLVLKPEQYRRRLNWTTTTINLRLMLRKKHHPRFAGDFFASLGTKKGLRPRHRQHTQNNLVDT
jgi:hypothetical protein